MFQGSITKVVLQLFMQFPVLTVVEHDLQ